MGSLIKRGGVYFGKLRDVDGKGVRYSTGQRNPIKAGNILAEWERRVAAGLPARPDDEEKRAAGEARKRRDATKGLTLHGLCEKFLAEYQRPKIKSMKSYWGTYGSYIRHGVQDAPIATLPAGIVRRADVEAWRDGFLSKHYAPSTVNVILGTLSTIYTWALDRELLSLRNPCRGVEEVPATARAAVPTIEEVRRLLQRPAAPLLSAMLHTALFAGLRHGELAALRWSDIDFKAKTPHLIVARSYRTTPKSGKPRAVPLHAALVPVLEDWRPLCPPSVGEEGLVFPKPRGDGRGRIVDHAMARESDMLGLPELMKDADCTIPLESARKGGSPHRRAWHAMRHVFASRCRDCGVSRDVLSELLGHSAGAGGAAVTATYLHDTPERLAFLAGELQRLWYVRPVEASAADAAEAPATPASPEALAPVTSRPPAAPAGLPDEAPSEPAAEIIDLAEERAARAARRAG